MDNQDQPDDEDQMGDDEDAWNSVRGNLTFDSVVVMN